MPGATLDTYGQARERGGARGGKCTGPADFLSDFRGPDHFLKKSYTAIVRAWD